MQLISRDEVLKRTSLSQPTLWRKEKAGEFPKSVRISSGRVAYDAEAVDEWIREILSQGKVA
ncbi:MAG: AlpA family phage regulatory protein [Proteobacteria bacterium]|nr:AlpA family phage regulatory protein [Pseudomonadota bacterium]